jgi:transposase
MELFVGVDVAKKHLDIHINGIEQADLRLENSRIRIENFIKTLQDLQQKGHIISLVICEATGGYEKLLSLMLRAVGLPIHIAHPNKVRNFAKAVGQFAKTDKIDAKILSEFARVFKPDADSAVLTPELETLQALFLRRQQLLDEKTRETNRLDKHIVDCLRQSIEKHIAWLKSELKEIDGILDKHANEHDTIRTSVELLVSVPGIGNLTAMALLTGLPELGKIEDKKLVALVGVAPLNRDSGKTTGKRYIQGGRGSVRKSLYMAAVVSMRFNPDMKIFYKRLRSNGKASKVALTAVMRKLVILLNHVARRQTPWEDRIGALQTA